MGIPSELISQLVKINNNTAKKKTESTVYGETVERDGSIYVRFDGSELLTPVSNTANVGPGERVIVLIKNHTATITGNLTSPAARVVTDPVTQKKTVENIDLDGVDSIRVELIEVKELLGEKVSVGELEGEFAAIDELQADNVSIKARLTAAEVDVSNLQADNANIKEKLTAAEGDISTLKTDNVTIKEKLSANEVSVKTLEADNVSVKGKIEAAEADITTLKADNITVKGKIEATEADISTLKTDNVTVKGKIEAAEADISSIKTDKLDATAADLKYATIGSLDAEKARIDDLSVNKLDANSATITELQAGLADIDTLIFGSASGTSIQTSFANSVIAQLGNAQIKSAMIDSVSASKITAGDIITNNIKVKSNDGKLLISDETIQISDDTRVRVQIGKDAANDYSINIWDDEGNLMFSKGGITDSAIKEAIIRNDMVKDDANISAKKLDIDSLFEEVNGSSKTIKSSKIMVDEKNQTLDVAFTSMTSDLNGAKDDISSQGTQISAIQGQITSKVWQQDIETAVDNIEVGGRNLILGSSKPTDYGVARGISYSVHEDGYVQIVAEADNDNYVLLQYNGSDYTIAETSLTEGDEFVISFTMRSPDSAAIPDIYIKSGMGYYGMKGSMSSEWSTVWYAGKWKDANPVNFHLGFSNRPGTYEVKNIKLEKGNKATDWTPAPEDVDGAVTTLNTKYSELKQSTDGVALTVAGHTTELTNKAGKGEVTDVSNRVTSVEANLEGFKSTVSSTYTTKDDFNNLEIGGRNLFKGYSFDEEIRLPDYQGVGSFSGDMFFNRFAIDMADYVGETFTISFWAKSPNGTTGLMLYNSNGNPRYFNIERQYLDYSLGNEWKYYSLTVMNLDMGEAYNPVYGCNRIEIYAPNQMGVLVKNIKLEKGNKATDWTPAPEDVEDDISGLAGRMEQTESKIDQKADSISLSAYASKTDLENGMNAVKQWKSKHVIDLRDTSVYSESKWYPVAGNGMSAEYYYYIQVFATLGSYCRPSWCTHENGFVVDFGVKTKAIGWGTTNGDTVILEDTYSWVKDGESSPVSYTQCRESSQPVLYLRGGGQYTVRTDYECPWTPHPSGYLWQSGAYSSEFPVCDYRPTPWGNHVASDEETKASLEVLTNGIKANVTETNDLKTRTSNLELRADGFTLSLSETNAKVDNASKTATNFLEYTSTDGLQVGNKSSGSWTGYRTQILSDAFNILDEDGMVQASYGKNLIELGKNNANAVISLCGGAGNIGTGIYDGKPILDISSDQLRLRSDTMSSIYTMYAEFIEPDNPDFGFEAEIIYVETHKDRGINLSCRHENSAYPSLCRSASIDLTLAGSIIGLADDICMTSRYDAIYDTVDGNITLRPAYDLILDPGYGHGVYARKNLCISENANTAGDYSFSGCYFGTDGLIHLTNDSGSASINFHYYGQSYVTSTIEETDEGVISINGMTFGVNKILWSGSYYMRGSQTANLSEPISKQANGIVLVFSDYSSGAAHDYHWNVRFVPKTMINLHNGGGHSFLLSDAGTFDFIGTKYLYINDYTIVGHDANDDSGTGDSGIIYKNDRFVLRYVIGV